MKSISVLIFYCLCSYCKCFLRVVGKTGSKIIKQVLYSSPCYCQTLANRHKNRRERMQVVKREKAIINQLRISATFKPNALKKHAFDIRDTRNQHADRKY